MDFMTSYKRLEKLCGDILNDDHGVSAYIDEMRTIPQGAYYVSGWNEDLKLLNHYRWIRNQIAHEPECTEETMCSAGDVQWLSDFYDRILNQTDPLAQYGDVVQEYYKSKQKKTRAHKTQAQKQCSHKHGTAQKAPGSKIKFWGRALIVVDIVAALILYLLLRQ